MPLAVEEFEIRRLIIIDQCTPDVSTTMLTGLGHAGCRPSGTTVAAAARSRPAAATAALDHVSLRAQHSGRRLASSGNRTGTPKGQQVVERLPPSESKSNAQEESPAEPSITAFALSRE